MTEDMTDLTDDQQGRECLRLRAEINEWFVEAKLAAAKWTPRPIPPDLGAFYLEQMTKVRQLTDEDQRRISGLLARRPRAVN